MTTTVSFATRDCLVMGCDSLATSSRRMISPEKIWNSYFDDKGTLKKDEEGNFLLKNFDDIWELTENLPYNQSPNVTKIFDLKPANAGILFAGIASVGDNSVKNIVEQFKSTPENIKYLKGNYTILGITNRLFKFLKDEYEEAFKDFGQMPIMEIIVSGYSKRYNRPEIYKIFLSHDKREVIKERKRKEYGVIFGGQVDVIERVVLGLDHQNKYSFFWRILEILEAYNEKLQKDYIPEDSGITLPIIDLQNDEFSKIVEDLNLFSTQWVNVMDADLRNFSEQAAIDFVHFLVNVMIKFQQFSSKLPTVGGDVHIAILTKSSGFNWISKEEYYYGNHSIPKYKD